MALASAIRYLMLLFFFDADVLDGGVLMGYNWEDFKRDFLIGAKRAPRDFFAPAVGFYRWVKKHVNASAERNIREARKHRSHAGRR